MVVAVALHSSLMHEVLHGHPTRDRRINEALVSLPIGVVWPYRRFRSLHLRHHRDERLTDPFDDPESFYQALWRHERMPAIVRLVLWLNNIMVLRLVIGPVLGVIGLVWNDVFEMLTGNAKVRRAWMLHLAGLAVVAALVGLVFDMPFWLYLVGPVWAGHALIAIRTFAEHQWSETPDGRTIIVERSLLGMLFLNNNLHLVHHHHPNVAWYRLPALYWARRDDWRQMNGGYVFPNYLALLMKFAFKPKEPVVHPAWRRDIEQRFIFLPDSHGHVEVDGANMPETAKFQGD